MVEIKVWAPDASLVELESCGGRFAMNVKDKAGWWTLNATFIQHGVDYSFRINGEGPFPDPRSAWQPGGVHGPSRYLEHASFIWNDTGWQQPPLESAIIYELHVGTFTAAGTFLSAIERLDYLKDLGVTHIELMPVAEFPGDHGWGYDGVNLYAPHHAYGGPDGLKQFVNACHCHGLAVVLDVVYNHLGPEGNYLSRFGPYFSNCHSTQWGDAINFEGNGSYEVRRFFIDNALMWLHNYHIDGLRIDAVHAIIDTSAVQFLEQLAIEVDDLEAELDRDMVLLAESDLNDYRIVCSQALGGYGMDAQWNDDFHHALHAILTGEQFGYYQDFGKISDLAKALTKGFVYDGDYSEFRGRHHGRPAEGISGHQLIGFLQNHDQVGNRALGERTSYMLSTAQLKIGATLVLTAPFVPMLFQGEEWAASAPFLYFTDYQDPELGEAVTEGRRKEFAKFNWDSNKIPDSQARKSFLQSKLNWSELNMQPHQEMLQWYQALIKLRLNLPSLIDGDLSATKVHFDEAARWLIMTRGSVSVVCNFSGITQTIVSEEFAAKKIGLSSEDKILLEGNAILLPPYSVVILRGVEI